MSGQHRAFAAAPEVAADDPDLVIAADQVDVVRQGKHLLREISWRVELDERWVVLGPNGAGKTTLLHLAAGRSHPTKGAVYVLGERIGRVDMNELRTRIGLSTAGLAERIPGGELVRDVVVTASWAVVGRFREAYDPTDLARAEQLLGEWGMAGFAEREYGTLSEGERKRTQIARALMTDPELLLLDEPAAGLDLGGREDLVARLSELAADPDAPAIVLVTHHVEEIPPSFTHALLLREGGIVAAGPVPDVITSEHLSETFGLPLTVTSSGGRFAARAA
ncbi:ABC transporter ATP-binding protein [Catellatospora sp. KI3]|uniref:ABC transporter ATP-binding protein n=1 Tax=Catellatospora sp. KI3 TaxID=3041620 RepID=UPI0024826BD5|nr:ABC transporter ATP-binding protein [Catellatospora sp. KI3]MDI1459619.1 ABC transporter ATP-binding protein [Catellatospora sp. KI3]